MLEAERTFQGEVECAQSLPKWRRPGMVAELTIEALYDEY
jgi:hypothetical protein